MMGGASLPPREVPEMRADPKPTWAGALVAVIALLVTFTGPASAARAASEVVTTSPEATGGAFLPRLTLTRGKLTLYRQAGAPDVSSLPPQGLDDVPSWADDAVTWAVHHGIMVGSGGSFHSREPVTRGQFARFDYRMVVDPAAWADPSAAPSTVPFRPSP